MGLEHKARQELPSACWGVMQVQGARAPSGLGRPAHGSPVLVSLPCRGAQLQVGLRRGMARRCCMRRVACSAVVDEHLDAQVMVQEGSCGVSPLDAGSFHCETQGHGLLSLPVVRPFACVRGASAGQVAVLEGMETRSQGCQPCGQSLQLQPALLQRLNRSRCLATRRSRWCWARSGATRARASWWTSWRSSTTSLRERRCPQPSCTCLHARGGHAQRAPLHGVPCDRLP